MQEYINVNGEKIICKSKAKKTGNGYIAEIDFQIEFDKKNYNFNCFYELQKTKNLIIKSLDIDIKTLDLIYDEIKGEWKGDKETFIQSIYNNFEITELKTKSLLEDVIRTFEIENARINKSKELNKLNTLDIFVEI